MSAPPRANLRSYRDFLLTYLAPQRLRVALMSALILTGIALQLANPQILRYFIDSATSGGSVTSLMLAGVLFVGIALANQAVSVLATYVSENVAWIATNGLRTDLVEHCLGLDMAFHKERTAGELIERIDGDVNTLSNFFSQSVVHLLGNALLLIGIILLLFREDWRVGTAIAAFALLALVTLIRIRSFALPAWGRERQKNAEFFGFLGEQLAGTEDVRANGATAYVMRRFFQLLRNWYPVNRRATLSSYSMFMVSIGLFGLGAALAFAIGAYLWSNKVISIGAVYLIFYYTTLLNSPIEQIRQQLEDLQKAGASIGRVKDLLQMRATIQDNGAAPLPTGALSVEFRDVSFGYNADEPVLKHVNIHLQPGQVLGVLGRTGSGKTTLARLLLRLYAVQSGEVRIGDVAVQNTRLRTLRKRIGMVTQDVQLFNATVRDNLTFFDRSISDARILAVLDDLDLMHWYQALPQGLDTELGSDGEGLSAGEAQLLAFTRVFLSNPGLVILDEASSRLDPATERRIERAMDKLLSGRSGIIIAHHLATVQRADDILILEDGHVLEYGRRATLAADPHSRFYTLLRTGLEEVQA
jgi:ATP-binding cassette, subfamily B, bacterial